MNDKLKNIIVVSLFLIIITGFMLANIIAPDKEISYSERRNLRQAPNFSGDRLSDGMLFSEYEKYFSDQFVLRDSFRTLNSIGRFYLMGLKDNNGIYITDDAIYKMVYPLNGTAIKSAANKFNSIYNQYLKNTNVYYSIIPDKNYFTAENNGYLSMDYNKLLSIMNENIVDMKYIDIFQTLEINDYYRTDIHWRQDKILDTAGKLLSAMNQNSSLPFDSNELHPFYGAYYGQSALFVKPDSLNYLTNDVTGSASVYNHITGRQGPIYDICQFGTVDSYNIFLSGPQALLTIENPLCGQDRELYIFRDSFGSSLAPLLLESYSKITLIDLRYISSSLLEQYITFKNNSDVLFIYETQILNQSGILK